MRHGGGCQDVGCLSLRSSDQPGLGSRERGAILLALMGLNCYRRTVDAGAKTRVGSQQVPTRQLRFSFPGTERASSVGDTPPPQRLLVLTQSRFVQ